MPVELAGLLTLEQFNFLMGISGIVAAFVILIIWSRGL